MPSTEEGARPVGTLPPEVAATWHFERNADSGLDPMTVPPSSPIEVWWKCEQGHEWIDRVSTRTSLPKWKNGDVAACRECTGFRIRHTYPGCGHTEMITTNAAGKGRPRCWPCQNAWWKANEGRLKAELSAAARGFAGRAREMIDDIEVEQAAPAPLVAEWRWWAAKHLQGALAAEQVMDKTGRVDQVLGLVRDRAQHLLPTKAEAGRAAATDGVINVVGRGHWAQGWLHHLTTRSPDPAPAEEADQAAERLRAWLTDWARAAVADHEVEDGAFSTARLTTALTRRISAWAEDFYPAELGRARVWRELGLPVLPPSAQRYGRLDVVLWHPVFVTVVVEIDSAPNRSSAAKLAFARNVSALPLWVRFGQGSVEGPEGVPVVDLRQELAPIHQGR